MHFTQMIFTTLIGALLTNASFGCSSAADHDWNVRRERLLKIYPPGETTREAIAAKWSPTKPEFSVTRPGSGWGEMKHPAVEPFVRASEARTGKLVTRVERYVGVDGSGLCSCWFYYDEQDRLVDTEWRYHSD